MEEGSNTFTREDCEKKLEVLIPKSVWDENSKFAALLVDLATTKLGQGCAYQSTVTKVEAQLEATVAAQKEYCKYKLFVDTLLEVLYEKSLQDSVSGQMSRQILSVISVQEASECMPDVNLGDLEFSFLDNLKTDPNFQKYLIENLGPEIEKKINQYEFQVIQMKDPIVVESKPNFWKAKFQQLPSLLEEEEKKKEEEQKESEQFEQDLNENLLKATSKQLEICKEQEKISKQIAEITTTHYTMDLEISVLKCKTLLSKLESIERQIFAETYSLENNECLKIVYDSLQEVKERLTKEVADTHSLLEARKALGPEYMQIVEEYISVTAEIEACEAVLNKTEAK